MRASPVLRSLILTSFIASAAQAGTSQLVLSRDANPETDIKGIVDLTVRPGFDNARVAVIVDGQKVAAGLRSPYHLTVDFGATLLEHKITVIAEGDGNKRVQWLETINHGHMPLSVGVKPVDLAGRVFEATVTAPESDPVQTVQFWQGDRHARSGAISLHDSRGEFRYAVRAGHGENEIGR